MQYLFSKTRQIGIDHIELMCFSSAAKDDFDYKNKKSKNIDHGNVCETANERVWIFRMIFIILIISNVVRWSEMLEEPATPSTEKLDA